MSEALPNALRTLWGTQDLLHKAALSGHLTRYAVRQQRFLVRESCSFPCRSHSVLRRYGKT